MSIKITIFKSHLKHIKQSIKQKIALYEPLEFKPVYEKFIRTLPEERSGTTDECLDRSIKYFLVENAYFALGEKYIQRILMKKTGITDPHDIRLLETGDYIRERLEKDGLKRLKGFRESAKFKTFLTTAVVRLLYDSWRHKRSIEENLTKFASEFDAAFDPPADDPLHVLIREEEEQARDRAAVFLPHVLARLDHREILVIKLKYQKNMNVSAISRTLGCSRFKAQQFIWQTERAIAGEIRKMTARQKTAPGGYHETSR
jgi:RNA polymerase sigma factor (sigma-70 family)